MTLSSEKIALSSNGFNEILDITRKISEFSNKENCSLINIYSKSPNTAIIIANQTQLNNLLKLIESNFSLPKEKYEIELEDDEVLANFKSIVLNRSLTIPVINNMLQINNNENIILLDLNKSMGMKEIIVSILT